MKSAGTSRNKICHFKLKGMCVEILQCFVNRFRLRVRVDLESVTGSVGTQEYTLHGMPVHYVSAHNRIKNIIVLRNIRVTFRVKKKKAHKFPVTL